MALTVTAIRNAKPGEKTRRLEVDLPSHERGAEAGRSGLNGG